jgi:Domain of unknown function (DUF4390)
MKPANLKLFALFCSLSLMQASLWANEPMAKILQLQVTPSDDAQSYTLELKFELQLSKKLIKALTSSIPLTFDAEISLYRDRGWLWKKHIRTQKNRFELSYQSLGQRYQIKNIQTGQISNHLSLEAALKSIGGATVFAPLQIKRKKSENLYFLYSQIRIVLSQLPVAIQAQAYLSPDWQVRSDWFITPLPHD